MVRKRHLKNDRPPRDPFEERRTKALKALKDYQRGGSFRENYDEVIDVLLDESDRGALILVGGILEDVLAERIIATLPNGRRHRENLLRQGGVLSSFQSKMIFGQALGVLDEATTNSLDIIRMLRNACAHSMREVTLRTPAVAEVLSLVLADEAAEQIKGDVHDSFLRLMLGFVMAFHVERILGKTREQAQAVVDRMAADTRRFIAEAEAQQESSPEKSS